MTIEQVPPVISNPFTGLLRSRKFWLAIVDVVLSTVLYFAGKYAGAALDDIKFLIAAYQPVIGLVIVGITVEDTAKAQAHAKIQVAAHETNAAVQVAELAAPEPLYEKRRASITEQDLPPLGPIADQQRGMPDRPIQPRR